MALFYIPILKARDAEFRAIAELDAAAVARVRPIFEVAPSERGPIKDAFAFIRRAQDSVPPGMAVAVDVQYLRDPVEGYRTPIKDISVDLAEWGIPMIPVIHLSDPPERLNDLGHAAERHGAGAVVRLGGPTADPDDEEAEALLGSLWEHTGLALESCDLLVDL